MVFVLIESLNRLLKLPTVILLAKSIDAERDDQCYIARYAVRTVPPVQYRRLTVLVNKGRRDFEEPNSDTRCLS